MLKYINKKELIMLEVNLYNLGYCDESEYTRVVCVSRYQGKFVFCFNKKRNGW